MIPLPTWMRRALFATAAMNIGAAAAFIPAAASVRAMAGFPEAHPFYLMTVGMFILLFGLGYLWVAMVGRADRLFITLAAVGKLSFFTSVVALWSAAAVPFRTAAAGTADLVFAVLFLTWLFTARAAPTAQRNALPADSTRQARVTGGR